MDTIELELSVDGVSLRIACLRRVGRDPALVCLHGFGSTKEDYADLSHRADFQNRELVFIDAPGSGQSWISDADALSIPFLVKTAAAVADALELERFHLSGHSMGGLTGLMLTDAQPERVLSFFNIEGNVAPEDCFLSRQIIDHPAERPDTFLKGLKDRARQGTAYSMPLYAAALECKVRPEAVGPIFRSMVQVSDNAPLMDVLARISCPKAFVYGEQNRHLSYLSSLPEIGVDVIEIPHSAHFPMYSNPPALWAAMSGFLAVQEVVQ